MHSNRTIGPFLCWVCVWEALGVAFTETGVEAAAAEAEGSPGKRAATRERAGEGETARRQTRQKNIVARPPLPARQWCWCFTCPAALPVCLRETHQTKDTDWILECWFISGRCPMTCSPERTHSFQHGVVEITQTGSPLPDKSLQIPLRNHCNQRCCIYVFFL